MWGFFFVARRLYFLVPSRTRSCPPSPAPDRNTESFDALADMIVELGAQRSTFIFVPGPRDPGIAGVLPRWVGRGGGRGAKEEDGGTARPPLPAVVTQKLAARVKTAVFASNPARVRYFAQELVFFREDTVTKLRRNCVRLPSEEDGEMDISAHVRVFVCLFVCLGASVRGVGPCVRAAVRAARCPMWSVYALPAPLFFPRSASRR